MTATNNAKKIAIQRYLNLGTFNISEIQRVTETIDIALSTQAQEFKRIIEDSFKFDNKWRELDNPQVRLLVNTFDELKEEMLKRLK